MGSRDWFLYVLRCADGTLYTGVTTDLARRVAEHNSGRGARYTSGRRPVQLIGAWHFPDRSTVQRAEARFRRLPRRQKLQLIARKRPVEGATFHQAEGHAAPSPVRFCRHCGSLLKEVTRPGDDHPRQFCTVCEHTYYRNAKPCAGALVMRDGRLLLVKRAAQPFQGYWDIPGGFLEADEHPEAGAIREVQEETGLKVELTGLFGFYVNRYGSDEQAGYCLNIYFLAEVAGGSERASDEIADAAWFAPNELPEKIAFDHARQVLDEWVGWMKEHSAI